jgi:hypothetical protein
MVTTAARALLFAFLTMSGSTYAFAQQQVSRVPPAGLGGYKPTACYAVQPGDTAARLALRFTGNADNRFQAWFQVVNPATGSVISKSRYNTIQSGWHVCVPMEMLRRGLTPPRYELASAASGPQQVADTQTRALDLSVLWWAIPLCVALSGLVLAGAGKYVGHRRVMVDLMSGFGGRFVSEFERPLFRPGTDPVLQSRLRFAPARHRLEILLAPVGRRTYPNLVDHRRNVEYDVDRVLQLLKDSSFSNEPPYAEGRWVVIPFRFDIDRP